MRRILFTIALESDLGTPLRGDTLFGQLCWALRLRHGESVLNELLADYTHGRPFLVVSDGLPQGFVPKPELPAPMLDPEPLDVFSRRKAWSKRKYLPAQVLAAPLVDAYRSDELDHSPEILDETLQAHNTIDRLTGTTGTGIFAPYQTARLARMRSEARFEIVALVDPQRLAPSDLVQLFEDISTTGYGRDASIGLGKFKVIDAPGTALAQLNADNAWLALAPSAPPRESLDLARSYWRPFTRFGRHGGPAFAGSVFKRPVLMADTGAVLAPKAPPEHGFIGTGLGGGDRLSASVRGTVHQGYAPVMPVNLEGWRV
ncbi:MAG: CRISPR-associated protein Csm7 [Sphingomonadales bacterium]|nr:MAG: CRISPR-associated protein Csm7 [Sphingomonadales bacterium]